MMQKITLLGFFVATILGGVTYTAKQKVMALEEELTSVNRRIASVQESRHLLRAEWGHLSNPVRLKRLAEKHLAMGPVKGWQIVSNEEVAERLETRPQLETGLHLAKAGEKDGH